MTALRKIDPVTKCTEKYFKGMFKKRKTFCWTSLKRGGVQLEFNIHVFFFLVRKKIFFLEKKTIK